MCIESLLKISVFFMYKVDFKRLIYGKRVLWMEIVKNFKTLGRFMMVIIVSTKRLKRIFFLFAGKFSEFCCSGCQFQGGIRFLQLLYRVWYLWNRIFVFYSVESEVFKFKKKTIVFFSDLTRIALNFKCGKRRTFHSFAGDFLKVLTVVCHGWEGTSYRQLLIHLCARLSYTVVGVTCSWCARQWFSNSSVPFCSFKTFADSRISEILIVNHNSQKYDSIVCILNKMFI